MRLLLVLLLLVLPLGATTPAATKKKLFAPMAALRMGPELFDKTTRTTLHFPCSRHALPEDRTYRSRFGKKPYTVRFTAKAAAFHDKYKGTGQYARFKATLTRDAKGNPLILLSDPLGLDRF